MVDTNASSGREQENNKKNCCFVITVFCSNGILTFGSKRRSFLSDIMMETNTTNDLSGRARKQQNELPIHIIVFCSNGILTFGSKRGSFLIGHHVGYQCVASSPLLPGIEGENCGGGSCHFPLAAQWIPLLSLLCSATSQFPPEPAPRPSQDHDYSNNMPAFIQFPLQLNHHHHH